MFSEHTLCGCAQFLAQLAASQNQLMDKYIVEPCQELGWNNRGERPFLEDTKGEVEDVRRYMISHSKEE